MRVIIPILLLIFMPGTVFSLEPDIAFNKSKSGLTIRSEPGIKNKKVFIVPFGGKVYIDAKSDKKDTIGGITDYWYKIYFNQKPGWAFGGFLTNQAVKGYHNITTGKFIALEINAYQHLTIEMADGTEETFWLMGGYIGIEMFSKMMASDENKGLNLRVTWAKRTIFNMDEEKEIEIREVDILEILNNISP